MTHAGTVRLFTALWPDAAVRARLVALRDAWRWPAGARPVADAKLHATLHFIGSFRRDRQAALREALGTVAIEPLHLDLAGSDVWRGGIAVALLAAEPTLLALHARVGAALTGLGVTIDPRPYQAHVTLARKATRAQPPAVLPALPWRANAFALVESRGGGYEVLATWGEADR
ncbi:MAG TPA: RNA 2',3'-cyclic phosphodiesterase [Caldimonas sp.]